jgi:dTDP-4-dehydrorhamnose 3,5-epimerase
LRDIPDPTVAPMDVLELSIGGPLLITPPKFVDERGFVSETYSARRLEPHIGKVTFVQDNHSSSRAAGTVRGLHFQAPPCAQAKLVRVVQGRAYVVAVDVRHGSPTFGRHVAVELTAENWTQLWVPIGFAHGFCTLEENTEVVYKLTEYFSRAHDRGVAWNDPALGIQWPVAPEKAVVSSKDKAQRPLAELPVYFDLG